jgi:hypothetical protein
MCDFSSMPLPFRSHFITSRVVASCTPDYFQWRWFSWNIHLPQAGHDVKSLMLNVASCTLFVLPLAMFFVPQYIKEELGVVAITMFLALLVPPRGWMRPHPYSDKIHNRP